MLRLVGKRLRANCRQVTRNSVLRPTVPGFSVYVSGVSVVAHEQLLARLFALFAFSGSGAKFPSDL